MATDIPELDRVLGGGLVPGSLVLVGGDPGIGKSTLMLQAAARLAEQGQVVAYVCGEESPRQVRMRASRLDVGDAPITLIPESSLDAALAAAEAAGATVVIVDSIQSVYIEGLESRSGGPAQLAEAGARLVAFAKGNEISTIVTGHVTKGGEIAGPRLLEHLVDAVLYFEGAEGGALRVLRAVKNRFGATDEVGVFEMTGAGLQSVENPSSALLEAHDAEASGCAVTAVIEGSRPLAIEVQALAVPDQPRISAPHRRRSRNLPPPPAPRCSCAAWRHQRVGHGCCRQRLRRPPPARSRQPILPSSPPLPRQSPTALFPALPPTSGRSPSRARFAPSIRLLAAGLPNSRVSAFASASYLPARSPSKEWNLSTSGVFGKP